MGEQAPKVRQPVDVLGRAEPEPFGKVTLATFTCTPVVQSPAEVITLFRCLQEPLVSAVINRPVNRVVLVGNIESKSK